MAEWNKPYQWIMQMKKEYVEKTGKDTVYDVQEWAKALNNPVYSQKLETIHTTQFQEFVLLKYNLIQLYKNEEEFDDFYQEMRSLVLDVKEETIVLAPFKKFFNLNETEENRLEPILEKIQRAKLVEIMDKLDGSMQSGRYYQERIFMSGSQALDPAKSWRLADGYNHLTPAYQQMLKEYPNYTFIFEYIGPKNQHVVSYKEEQAGLYVIGMRCVDTGEQLSYGAVREVVSRYEGVKMVAFEAITFDAMLEKMKTAQANEKEGWIVNIDGHLLKIKCDDYVNIHKTLSAISSVNVVIERIAEETFDDFLSKIPVNYQERVKRLAREIFTYIASVEKQVERYYAEAPKEDAKGFMVWVDAHVENAFVGYVKNRYIGRPYNALKSGHRYKKAKEIGLTQGYSALFDEASE